jgi:choline kinase
MTSIILNSGIGSRLIKHTTKIPKGLVSITENDSIFSRQIRLLHNLNNNTLVVTTGYLDGMIQEYAATVLSLIPITYYYSPRYNTTNYITSLELLYNKIDDDVLLLHGDLVFENSVLNDIVHSNRSVVVIDSSIPLPEKDFKARIVNGKIVEIGINVFGSDCAACQPLYKLNRKDWALWQNVIHEFCNDGKDQVYAENALNTITDKIDLFPLDINGRFCTEIDNEEDLMWVKKILNKREI